MGYKSDIDIAQSCEALDIKKIAEKAGIDEKYVEAYGKKKAKISLDFLKNSENKTGKLILVTAITAIRWIINQIACHRLLWADGLP